MGRRLPDHARHVHSADRLLLRRLLPKMASLARSDDLARELGPDRAAHHAPPHPSGRGWSHDARALLPLLVHRRVGMVLVPRLHLHRPQLLQLGLLDRARQHQAQPDDGHHLRSRHGSAHLRLVADLLCRFPPRHALVHRSPDAVLPGLLLLVPRPSFTTRT